MKLTVLYLLCTLISVSEAPKSGRIFLSKNQGENWVRTDNGFPEEASVNALAMIGNTIFAGTESDGLFLSEDGLKTWKPSSKGLPAHAKINALIAFNGLLFAGTYLNGVFVSSNQGASWKPASEGVDNTSIRSFYSAGNFLFVGTDMGIYQSKNEGKTWVKVFCGAQINSFASAYNVHFAATSLGILRSEDGLTWTRVWTNTNGFVSSIARDGDNLLALTGEQVQVGLETGKTWITLDKHFGRLMFQPSPVKFTFRLTPVSGELFVSPWKNSIKSLRQNNSFNSEDLPARSPFTQILDTPFGLLVAVSFAGC